METENRGMQSKSEIKQEKNRHTEGSLKGPG